MLLSMGYIAATFSFTGMPQLPTSRSVDARLSATDATDTGDSETVAMDAESCWPIAPNSLEACNVRSTCRGPAATTYHVATQATIEDAVVRQVGLGMGIC